MKFLLLCFALFGASLAQFSETAQEAILQVHNDLRSRVALGEEVGGGYHSTATNMIKLRWSPGCARSAQAFVDTCPEDHSDVANVGENMYFAWTSKNPNSLDKYGSNAAASWAEEFSDYGWTSTTLDQETFDSGVGHATQMIWAKTGYVGCGVKNCGKDLNTYTNAYKIIVVCHYRVQGNVLDDPIYEEGDTCSHCPDYRMCEKDTGLCA